MTIEWGYASAEEQAESHRKEGTTFGDDMAEDLRTRSTLALEDEDRKVIEQAREELHTLLGILTCDNPPSAEYLRVSDRGELEMLVDLLSHALRLRNVVRRKFAEVALGGPEALEKAHEEAVKARKEREEWEDLLTFLHSPDEDKTKH